MKIIDNLRYVSICLVAFFCFFMSSCDENVTDFDNNAKLSGLVKDQKGNVVAGDITSNTLVVHALGEGDQVATDIRVKGDGTYQNDKLFPKNYKISLEGPVKVVEGETVTLNFSKEQIQKHNFVVIPYISIKKPVIEGKPTSSSIKVKYEMSENLNYTIANREIYVSTVPYPTAQTGSGPFYDTKTTTLSSNEGTVTITGLTSKTEYFIRIGVEASGTDAMNYSQQINVTTP